MEIDLMSLTERERGIHKRAHSALAHPYAALVDELLLIIQQLRNRPQYVAVKKYDDNDFEKWWCSTNNGPYFRNREITPNLLKETAYFSWTAARRSREPKFKPGDHVRILRAAESGVHGVGAIAVVLGTDTPPGHFWISLTGEDHALVRETILESIPDELHGYSLNFKMSPVSVMKSDVSWLPTKMCLSSVPLTSSSVLGAELTVWNLDDALLRMLLDAPVRVRMVFDSMSAAEHRWLLNRRVKLKSSLDGRVTAVTPCITVQTCLGKVDCTIEEIMEVL